MGLDEPAWDRMRHWSEHAFSDGTHDSEQVASALQEFGAFGADLLADRRRAPGDDLISELVAAADQEGASPRPNWSASCAGWSSAATTAP